MPAMFKLAESATAEAGEKLTLIEQLAPAARPVPQSLVCEKLVGFRPPNVMAPTGMDTAAGLLSVNTCATLVPTNCGAKVSVDGNGAVTVQVPRDWKPELNPNLLSTQAK